MYFFFHFSPIVIVRSLSHTAAVINAWTLLIFTDIFCVVCGFSLSICNGSSRRLHDVSVWNAIVDCVSFALLCLTICIFLLCVFLSSRVHRFRTLHKISMINQCLSHACSFSFSISPAMFFSAAFCFFCVSMCFFWFHACFYSKTFCLVKYHISHSRVSFRTKWLGRLLVLRTTFFFVSRFNLSICRVFFFAFVDHFCTNIFPFTMCLI